MIRRHRANLTVATLTALALLAACATEGPPTPENAQPGDTVTIDLGAFDASLAGRSLGGRFDGKTIVPIAPPSGSPPASGPSPAPSAGDHLSLMPVPFSALAGWTTDQPGEAIGALARSCAKLVELPGIEPVGREGVGGNAEDWLAPCGALRGIDPKDNAAARAYFETWFAPFRATAGSGKAEGTFTGYYEAELKGSLTRDPKNNVPLYARPDDLMALDLGPFDPSLAARRIWGRIDGRRFVPYWTRAEIEQGKLGPHAKVLLWVEDPVEAHILSIQGSGRVVLPDGGVTQVGFDGTNGRTFLGISRILIDAGKLNATHATMPDTRAWLETHPGEAQALMDKNPRYVFFRMATGDGPLGAEGVALTPQRSLAVDPRFVPLGVPLWLDTSTADGAPFRHVMVAQDTGAAIKGPVRGDIFWGAGEAAFAQAGRMKSPGTYYLLLPRKRTPQMAETEPREAR